MPRRSVPNSSSLSACGTYVTIHTNQGKEVLVDVEDYSRIAAFRVTYGVYNQRPYATLNVSGHSVMLHRVLMTPPKNMVVDHINGNGLDNRRQNLRVCTFQQNLWNGRKRAGTRSRFKGVCWDKRRGRWLAAIRAQGKCLYLGEYHSEKNAAIAYNIGAYEHFGDFAKFNDVG